MRRGVCSPRERARYTAPTPPFSSAWQIVRGMDSAFKTPPISPPRHPFGGVSSKGYFPQSSSASPLHGQRFRVFDFNPMRWTPRAIWRAKPLRYDPLATELASLGRLSGLGRQARNKPRLKPIVAALAEAYQLLCCNVFWISGPRRRDDANRRTFQSQFYGRAHAGTKCLVHVGVTGVR